MTRWLLVAAALLGLVGCASMPAAQYQTAVETRPLGAGPGVAVGEARAADGVRNAKVSLRGAAMVSSAPDRTFSGYLREALVRELSASGRYSQDAARSIELELLRHDVNANGIKEGRADLSVRIAVTGGGKPAFDNTYEVSHAWPSSFIGAVAIPAAFDNYPTAVQKLLVVVMSDPGFQAAIE